MPSRVRFGPDAFSIYAPERPSAAGPVPYRARMESAFRADFSGVRATRAQGAWLRPRGAAAAAWSESVAFAAPSPSPRLVAHELTHVLQLRRHGAAPAAPESAGRAHPAELEASRLADSLNGTDVLRPRARPAAAVMYSVDDVGPDPADAETSSEEPPLFADQPVGEWGQSIPATLVARERLEVSFRLADRSEAIVDAVFRREPIVIMREDGRLWPYRLDWEGFSGAYSRFTNSSTLFSRGSEEAGGYAVSNVTARPEVEAFVTEDGGVLSPPGAGRLFYHTGGSFEDPLASTFQNAVALLGGLRVGLEDAKFGALALRLEEMAALNVVFPVPFAAGALAGIAQQAVDLLKWLNPEQWKAAEAAARETVLLLADPDGEALAAIIGEHIGRTQAASLDALLERSLPVFAYEVGKLVGPTIVETVLAFIGIEIGPFALIQKALQAIKASPKLLGVLRKAALVLRDVAMARPGAAERVGTEITEDTARLAANELSGRTPGPRRPPAPDAVDDAARLPGGDGPDPTVYEVDEQGRLLPRLGPMPPGSVVARSSTKSTLRDTYFEWAANRAGDSVEVALARHVPSGDYVVVVGDVDRVFYLEPQSDWFTLAHSHPGAALQPGVHNPSPQDLFLSMRGSRDKVIRKFVHSQGPDGAWLEVEYGIDKATGAFYVQPIGGERRLFDDHFPDLSDDAELMYRFMHADLREQTEILANLPEEERTYATWWAQQFIWDD